MGFSGLCIGGDWLTVVLSSLSGFGGSGSQVDSARMNLASSFVNGFVNAAFGQDKLLTDDGNKWLYKNKDHGEQEKAAAGLLGRKFGREFIPFAAELGTFFPSVAKSDYMARDGEWVVKTIHCILIFLHDTLGPQVHCRCNFWNWGGGVIKEDFILLDWDWYICIFFSV